MALVSPNVQKGRLSPSPVPPPRGLSAKTTPPSQCHGETQGTARSGYRPDLQCPRSRMDWLSGIPADALGPQPGRDRRRRADLLSAALRRLCLQIKHSTPACLRIAIGYLTPGEARARGALAHPRTRRDECFRPPLLPNKQQIARFVLTYPYNYQYARPHLPSSRFWATVVRPSKLR